MSTVETGKGRHKVRTRKIEAFARICLVLSALMFLAYAMSLAVPRIVQAMEYTDQSICEARGESPQYLSLLDGPDAEGYLACCSMMSAGKPADDEGAVGRTDASLSFEDLDITTMLCYPSYDHPLLSAYSTGSTLPRRLTMDAVTGRISIETPATKLGDDFCEMYAEADAAIRSVAQSALDSSGGTVLGYARALTAHYAEGIEYSEGDSESAHCNDIYGAAVNGSSCCLGYAATMKHALDLAGLPNIIATGEKDDESHAWNMIRVSGKWLMIDVTATSAMYHGSGAGSVCELGDPWRYCLRDLDSVNATTRSSYKMSEATCALLAAS